MLNSSKPTTKKELRSFLGLVGYYQKFMPHFATIADPLTDAMKKGQPLGLQWDESMNAAYLKLKQSVSCSPILHLADLSHSFVLRTDASEKGIGSVLLQEHDGTLFPMEFASRKLKDAERRYAIIERE